MTLIWCEVSNITYFHCDKLTMYTSTLTDNTIVPIINVHCILKRGAIQACTFGIQTGETASIAAASVTAASASFTQLSLLRSYSGLLLSHSSQCFSHTTASALFTLKSLLRSHSTHSLVHTAALLRSHSSTASFTLQSQLQHTILSLNTPQLHIFKQQMNIYTHNHATIKLKTNYLSASPFVIHACTFCYACQRNNSIQDLFINDTTFEHLQMFLHTNCYRSRIQKAFMLVFFIFWIIKIAFIIIYF